MVSEGNADKRRAALTLVKRILMEAIWLDLKRAGEVLSGLGC